MVAEDALANRLVELYKADEPDALTVILQADGFADLLEQTEFLERVSEQDQAIIERVRVLKAEAKKQKELLAELEQRVEDAANAILAQRNELARSKNQLVASQSELAGVRDDRRSVLSEVHDSRVQLEGDLRELEAEQARVTAQLQGAQGARARQAGLRRADLAGQRASRLRLRDALGQAARGRSTSPSRPAPPSAPPTAGPWS